MTEDPWIRAIPEKYIPGHIIKGKVTKITNFGAFVELEPDLEGLLHISELADHKIDKPGDIVNEGEEVEVKILKVEAELRKIGLSLRRAQWAAEEQASESTQQQSPAGIETVIPDTDADRITIPQQTKDDKPKETETDKAEAGDVEEPKVTEESEQAEAEQTSPEADSQASGDSSAETKAEADAEKAETDADNK